MPARAFADPDPNGLGDEALMLAYAGGDAGAFDALYARHRGGVYRYLVRQCGGAGTADELFQDVWMSVIRARTTYTPSAKFATWLYRIARNRLIDHWRSDPSVNFVAPDGDDDDADPLSLVPGTRGDEPEVRAGAREQAKRIGTALAELPGVQREAFLLQQEGGLELAEIAALTGAGIETVKSRLRYAVAKLRLALRDLQ